MAIGAALEQRGVPCCGSLFWPAGQAWGRSTRSGGSSCPGQCAAPSLCRSTSHNGSGGASRVTTRQTEYARIYSTTPYGAYQQRGVRTVRTSWAMEVESARAQSFVHHAAAAARRRRDVLPTRHETDFSVIEFADYQKDAEWVEFMTASRFASGHPEEPASLRTLLPEFDDSAPL